MHLHSHLTALDAIRDFTAARCPACGGLLVAPLQSEFVESGEIRHHWECDDCGCFSTTAIPIE